MLFRRSLYHLLCLLMIGCSLSPSNFNSRTGEAKERLFHTSTNNVWRATQLVLQDYPIRVSDSTTGILETKQMKGDHWVPPHQEGEDMKSGLRYRLRIKVVKVRLEKGVATKVIIHKKVTLQRDFFASLETLPSDGLEETAILYRIGRELQIDKVLERLQSQQP